MQVHADMHAHMQMALTLVIGIDETLSSSLNISVISEH